MSKKNVFAAITGLCLIFFTFVQILTGTRYFDIKEFFQVKMASRVIEHDIQGIDI